MKKRNLEISFIVLSLIFLLMPRQTYGNEKLDSQVPVYERPAWKLKMQDFYTNLNNLLSDVCSNKRYFDEKNSTRIQSEIKAIADNAHNIETQAKSSPNDPTTLLLSRLLTDDLDEASKAFQSGNRLYARTILESVPQRCLACHTRSDYGPDFKSLAIQPNAELNDIESGEFYAATRQFDRSVDSFQKYLRISDEKSFDPFLQEKAAREALVIAVRFRKDPKLALSIVQTISSNPNTPEFLKSDSRAWKKTIDAWSKEPSEKLATVDQLKNKAMRLIAKARAMQSYAFDHSADIYYLRASGYLYDAANKSTNSKDTSEALMLLGMCYEVLNPHNMENLHNEYYEACIEASPHTPVARDCYKHYEQSIYFGFTGSSGTHIPDDVREKLLKLWSIALDLQPTQDNKVY